MQDLKSVILDLSRQSRIAPLTPWFEARLEQEIEAKRFLSNPEIQNVQSKLIADLVSYRKSAGVEVVVLGMSGGVDSALTAALFKAAGWRVIGHTLPIEQDPEETARGIEACEALGIEHLQIDLSDQYRSMVVALGRHDLRMHDDPSTPVKIRRGNIRARVRMIALYDQAHRHGGLVASTDNFSELAAGFWTLHGDVGDLSPIQALLKSWEVPAMARAAGVPERTWRATPTDGLGIDAGDEAQLGASYLEWDLALLAMLDVIASGVPNDREALLDVCGVGGDPRADQVFQSILDRSGRSWFKRAGSICLAHPQEDRYAAMAALDAALFRPTGT